MRKGLGSLAGKHHVLKGSRELMLEEIPLAVRERFVAKLRPSGDRGCIVYSGALNGDGYGVVVISEGRRNRRFALAHRIAYAMAHGSCPPLLLDHTCETRSCCHAPHLRPTTEEGNTPGIYDAPAIVRSAEKPARPIRCLEGDGEIVTYPSVDALWLELERRAEERLGPKCRHGYRVCAPCRRDRSATPAPAMTAAGAAKEAAALAVPGTEGHHVNTWSSERS